MKKLFKNKSVVSFMLSFCLGLIIVLSGIIAGKEVFSLVADYNLQQVPFGMLINDALKEGVVLVLSYFVYLKKIS